MKILDVLGLGKKKISVNSIRALDHHDGQGREEKILPAVQNMCCGSCGGQGHAKKKESSA